LSAWAFQTNGENEMTAKKTVTERSAASAGKGVANDVIERRAAVNKFVEYAERIARDRNASRSVVQRAGIFTETGRLTKHYKK
jgi:hypothetical protein